MRLTSAALLSLLAALTLAAPIPSPYQAGDGPAAITAPLVDTLVGSDNVNSIDAIADVLGVAQYDSGDNPEDQDALPQHSLDNFIGQDGALTATVKGLPVRRGVFGDALAKELVDINGDVDLVLAENDKIANNLLGVCDENTTSPEALCDGVTKTATKKE